MKPGKETNAAASVPTSNVWKTIRDAYTFAFPLILMDATKTAGTNTVEATPYKAPANQFLHARQLATASFRQVVTPNVDTIYSQLFVDLSADALVIEKPAADRFLMLQVMDAWSNSVAILGTGGDTNEARAYLLTGPGFRGTVPAGMTEVKMPTNMGWILGRTVCFGEEDLPNIYAIQEKLTARTLSVFTNGGRMPAGSYDRANDFVPIQRALSLGPAEYFGKFNELLKDNPAFPADAEAMKAFAPLGIGPGLRFDVSILGDEEEAAWATMRRELLAYYQREALHFMMKNGVFHSFGEPISRFGTEYVYRAAVAVGGFGANPVEVAVYPKAATDSAGDLLNGASRYVLRFDRGALPPVRDYGFWSITAYGDDDFLIDNELNRFCINDRSAVRFSEDGSLNIYLQAKKPEDPALAGNWLPVGDRGFHLFMRIYLPEKAVLDGSWKAPEIRKADQ